MTLFCLCLILGSHAFAQTTEAIGGSTRMPVPTGKYITGGVLGSALGFGIGHAVQGRYQDGGWLFTATEGASLAVLMIGLGSCSEETENFGGERTKKTTCSNGGLVAIGFASLIGFRVWEIVDVWTGARPVDEKGPQVYFNPNPESPGLGLAWNF